MACLGSTVEDEFVHINSVAMSGHLVGRQVHSGSPCIPVCLDTAGADAILLPTTALHLSRTG